MISPFTTIINRRTISIERASPILYSDSKIIRLLVYIKAGISIAESFLHPERPLHGHETEIISQIHAIRFNSQYPYIITGGHFHQSYVRNRGIFFNALLDSRIPSTQKDWQERQALALKTVSLDLEVFRQAKKDYTTIVPLGKSTFTAINIYARPSDSLFSILYTLSALVNPGFLEQVFPSSIGRRTSHKLMTAASVKKLITEYKHALKELIENYLREVIDSKTHLVRKDMLLSSARDGIKRQSSFYDNVIAWATYKLAEELGVHLAFRYYLLAWKQVIIAAFWDDVAGIFRDDLSDKAYKEELFSADSFIVISTGFLQVNKSQDRAFLAKIIDYIKKNELEKPFPLHYSKRDECEKLYWPVRFFAPSYMGRSIWSHWGMEYIKILILLSRYNKAYLQEANKHLLAYKHNIESYGGYPELYDSTGNLFSNRIYKSVLRNSWVINYEQAKMLLQNAEK